MEILILWAMLMKVIKKISLQQFLPMSKAEIQGLLYPVKTILEIFSCMVSVSPGVLNTV
jgi:hypothetical protein